MGEPMAGTIARHTLENARLKSTRKISTAVFRLNSSFALGSRLSLLCVGEIRPTEEPELAHRAESCPSRPTFGWRVSAVSRHPGSAPRVRFSDCGWFLHTFPSSSAAILVAIAGIQLITLFQFQTPPITPH